MKKFLSLKEKVYFVKGPVNGAIYDLKHESIQHAHKTLADILEACVVKGMTVDDSVERILSNMNRAGKDKMRNLLIEHPLFSLCETPQPYQPIQPSVDASRKTVWLELTQKCNLRCLHCYADAGPEMSAENPLPAKKWGEIIQEASEMGFSGIQFTGGEPLLYPELINLLRIARKLDYELIEVYTNLTLLSDKLLDEFKTLGVCVATSFYSYDRETHNKITLNKSSYDRTLNSIKAILSAGIPIRVGVILMEQNSSHAEKTGEFLKELGVPEDKIGFDRVRCSGRGLQMPHTKSNVSPTRLKTNHQGEIVWNSCWPGKIAVKSDGTVSPCVFVREAVDTVKGKTLQEVVRSERLQKYWKITLDDVEGCKDCEFRYGCLDCRANALNDTGELYAKNPFCAYNPYTGIWAGNFEQRSNVKPVKKSAVQWEKLDSRAILYDSSGNFSFLNSTGAMIWEFCDGKHSIKEIADEFLCVYDADVESVHADVKRMVSELTMRGFLETETASTANQNRV